MRVVGNNTKMRHRMTLLWLCRDHLKRETGILFIVAKKNAIRNNYVKTTIVKTKKNYKCRWEREREMKQSHKWMQQTGREGV